MKGIPACTFYHQIYYKDRGDEVAYCKDCDEELLTIDNTDWSDFFLCLGCWNTVNGDNVEWRVTEKDSEHNPPDWVHKYHADYIIRQGSGDWENIKYRTQIDGTIDEIDKLQSLIRNIGTSRASTLIEALSLYDSLHRTKKEENR